MRLPGIATLFFLSRIAATQGLAEQLDAWDKEVIPALANPDIAAQVEVYNAPEEWVYLNGRTLYRIMQY